VTNKITGDGQCHWMEGVLLVGVYAILGLAFFDLPELI
jgi:Ca2+:H+ antiporter